MRNGQMVVGPRLWSWSMFWDYLDEEKLDSSQLPKSAPDEAIFTDQWSILPTTLSDATPALDEPYEQLAGPFWTIYSDYILGQYSSVPCDIEAIKGNLREKIMNNRYVAETAPITYTINGSTVNIDTSRENRNSYFLKSLDMTDTETSSWKFKQGWFDVTKTDFTNINQLIKTQIQTCFDWERQIHQQITNAQTIEELKSINLIYSPQS